MGYGGTVFGAMPWEAERVYVDVVALTKADGFVVPLEIGWSDGTRYAVKNASVGRRAMCSAGSFAMKYTVDVLGKTRELWFDVADGRWFVEVERGRRRGRADEPR